MHAFPSCLGWSVDGVRRGSQSVESVVRGPFHKTVRGLGLAHGGGSAIYALYTIGVKIVETLFNILQSRFQARCANGPLPRIPGTMLCCSVFYEPCRQQYNID